MYILHSEPSMLLFLNQVPNSISNAKAHFSDKRLHKDLSFLCNQAKNKNWRFFKFWNKMDAIQIIEVYSITWLAIQ